MYPKGFKKLSLGTEEKKKKVLDHFARINN